MKKEEKILAVLFLMSIFLILSVNLVSANLFSDIGDFFKKIFGGEKEEDNLKGELASVSPGSSAYTDSDISTLFSGLVAYYPFEGNANDKSGNGNDGVVNGATVTSGKIGQAYSFDGINDYIEVSKEKLNINGLLTVSAWIKPSGITNATKYFNILAKESINYNGYGIEIYGKNNWIEFWTRNSTKVIGTYWIYTNPDNINNKWTHVLGVYDGTYNKIYINGVLMKAVAGTTPYSSGLYPLRIGYSGRPYRPDLNIDSYFPGIIDEVKIWNRALTDIEIKEEYDRGTCTPNCAGKQCGDDGCGGSCGICGVGQTCNANGQCVSSCVPKTCAELGKECGKWNNDCGGEVYCGDCQSGQTCSNGICVNQTCTDSDGGKNYFVKGTVFRNTGMNYTDSCLGIQLAEYFCNSDGTASAELYNCTYGCGDGACSNQTVQTCIDSDKGKDYFTKGIVNYLGKYNYTDYCVANSKNLTEFFCNQNGIVSYEKYECSYGCFIGACLNETSACRDSDNGKDYYTKGVVSFFGRNYTDLCYEANKKIFEYFCKIDGVSGGEWFNCTDGCRDGACLSNLIAYYSFNGNANDESGNGNNGVVNGATVDSGKIGQAYSFDGINDYIEVPKEKLNINGPLTISAWIKPIGLTNASKYFNILAKESINYNGYGIEIYGKPNWIEFWTRNSTKVIGTYWIYTNPNNINNKWTHVVGVYDGTYNKIYINGVLKKTAAGAAPYSSGLYPLRIGYSGRPYRPDLNIDSYFSGIIDEVKIWNRALTDNEIKEEYNRTGTCTPNCAGKQCGDDGCGGSCGSCASGQTCNASGQCVNSKFNVSLSLATLKDSYSVNEQIKLTDPPDEIVNVNENIIDNSDINNNRINNYNDVFISNSEDNLPQGNYVDKNGNRIINYNDKNMINKEIPKSKGYIIEFEDKPLVIKDKELKDIAKENENVIKSMSNFNPLKYGYMTFSLREKDVPKKFALYKDELESNKEKIKTEIKEKLQKENSESSKSVTGNIILDNIYRFVTGKAVSEDNSNLKVMNEYENVFNGIALDITLEESEKIKNIQGVKSVSPNLEVHTTLMDSVPLINADDVWRLDADGNDCSVSGKECLTGKGIKIAVIDTGIDYTHEDLGNCNQQQFLAGNCEKVIGGYDFVNNDNDPMDDYGHGTHVAGIAAGSGQGGLKGIAPDVRLYAYKVLNSGGGGSVSNIISAIERAVDPNQDEDFSDKVDIMSMSVGAECGNYYYKYCGPYDPMSTAVNNAVDAGVIAVVAAGNSGRNGEKNINSPGAAEKALTVGASLKKDYPWMNCVPGQTYSDCGICGEDGKVFCNYKVDKISSYSSKGPVIVNNQNKLSFLVKPDIIAPGTIICSARWDNIFPPGENPNYYPCLDDKHVQVAGTSMATPMVAGAAALLKQKHPDWTPEEIKMALKNTAKDLGYEVNTQGSGRIDILKAVESDLLVAKIETNGDANGMINEGNEIIDIIGTAKGDNFDRYELYYGIGKNPQEWIKITESTSLIDNGILYQGFDVSKLTKGINYLKLIVYGINGEKIEDKSGLLLLKNAGKRITSTSKKSFRLPLSISGNKIAWAASDENDNCNLYVYNLETKQERRLTAINSRYSGCSFISVSISGNKIAYSNSEDDSFDIYLYNLDTNIKERISSGPELRSRPYISENKIVWIDRRTTNRNLFGWSNIYMYNLDTNQERKISNENLFDIYVVDIFENKIIWYDELSNTYIYDLVTNQEKIIEGFIPSRNRAVWTSWPSDDEESDIYMCDLAGSDDNNLADWCDTLSPNGGLRRITSDSNTQSFPSISGDKIVWMDARDYYNWDIYMYDLITNQEIPIVKDDKSNQFYPIISGDKIFWFDDRSGDWDIYMLELSTNCGNNIKEGAEECDGADNSACPNRCSQSCTCLPQSKLENKGDFEVSGNLILKLQKNVDGVWTDIREVVNQQVTIPAQGLIKLDTGLDNLGNQVFAGWNNLNVVASSAGDYRVYAKFESSGKIIETNWEFRAG